MGRSGVILDYSLNFFFLPRSAAGHHSAARLKEVYLGYDGH